MPITIPQLKKSNTVIYNDEQEEICVKEYRQPVSQAKSTAIPLIASSLRKTGSASNLDSITKDRFSIATRPPSPDQIISHYASRQSKNGCVNNVPAIHPSVNAAQRPVSIFQPIRIAPVAQVRIIKPFIHPSSRFLIESDDEGGSPMTSVADTARSCLVSQSSSRHNQFYTRSSDVDLGSLPLLPALSLPFLPPLPSTYRPSTAPTLSTTEPIRNQDIVSTPLESTSLLRTPSDHKASKSLNDLTSTSSPIIFSSESLHFPWKATPLADLRGSPEISAEQVQQHVVASMKRIRDNPSLLVLDGAQTLSDEISKREAELREVKCWFSFISVELS